METGSGYRIALLVLTLAGFETPGIAQTVTPGNPLPSMQAIAQALGVSCDYCHTAQRGSGLPEPKKDIARAMIATTRDLNAKVEAVSRSRNRIALKFRAAGKLCNAEGTHLLVATGRVPNSDTLHLPAAAITTDARGFIRVNEKLETSAKDIYALGDIKGGPAFTHISYDDFRILRANLLENGSATTANRLVPYTVFIDPQLGRIGLSEAEARAQNRAIRVAKMPMNYVARALEVDESRGFMKAIVDANTNQILGAAILGIEGGEIMAQLQIAMMGQIPYTTLRDAVFAHPTLAESLNNLFTKFQD